ncbi:hypothetical protein [Nocardia jiangxiensis]|uniref:Condensation domain-containing protein n=1 Tax=Nocardia jiangxiensis TaxID=282685 RepID=A0ABW6S066_9NOCA|nr:hypothetical protein [Nocardia jiangxiensis]
MPADQRPMSRLGVVDEIFLRTHRGMGTPIALQGLWRTADRVGPEVLEQVHAALRTGPLGRRVVRARIPGARPYWRANVSAHPLEITERVLHKDEVLDWADTQGFDLDPEYGPGWRLATAALADGGSVVALTCSHVLADGRGLAIAVDQALSGAAAAEVTAPQSDWADARRQWGIVLGGAARALRQGVPERASTVPSRSDPADTCGVVLEIPVADWRLAATARAATGNSLFVHLIAQMLWDSGFDGPEISASIPVDTRGEPRVDNDMAMTAVTVTRSDTPAALREKCRAAYEYRISSPGGMPEEILQVLPARAAHALTRGAGERDILCSNIGQLPNTLSHLGPHHCRGVAARAIHPGLTPPLPRTRLSAYLSRLADTYTLALTSLDPAHTRSPRALHDLARSVLAAHDLTPTFW